MSTCADLREHLVEFVHGEFVHGELVHGEFVHGELDSDVHAAVSEHVGACETCAAEAATIGSVLELVASGTEIDPTASETSSLFSAIDAELEAGKAPILDGGFVRGAWDRAVWHYEHSSGFRRLTITSIGLHAAVAAGVAWLLVGSAQLQSQPHISVGTNDEIAALQRDLQRDLQDEMGGFRRAVPDEIVAAPPRVFVEATRDGVVLPSAIREPAGLRGRGEKLRAPTFGILIRLRAVLDDDGRSRRLAERIGDVGPRADAAVADGLAWLAKSRSDDGRWGPTPKDGAADVRDGVTAAVVLAFVQSGHSASDGEYAETLAPAIRALEKRLHDGAAAGDTKPVYSQALAIRALAWSWALDFRNLSPTERESRQKLLAKAGASLVAAQHENGGFGYRPGDERPDASCTLFVAGALSDLRLAGVLRADATLRRAGKYLASLRSDDGSQSYAKADDRLDDPTLTAGLLAHAGVLGVKGDLSKPLAAVRAALVKTKTPDALLAWTGMQALRSQRGLAPAMTVLLDRQRDDGSWPSATDRHCRLGGDDLTTAMGVLAVTRVYLP